MSRRLSFYILVGLATVFIFFLALNQHYNNYIEHRLQPIISDAELRSRHVKIQQTYTSYIRGTADDATQYEIQDVIQQQRRSIEIEMDGYAYTNGSNLDDFVMEKGGRPLRSIILTSWRSGSTFLGEVINAHPATYYHYEPLLDFGIIQVRGSPLAEMALQNIEALLKCNYTNMEHYLNFGKLHVWLFNHNSPLWKQCQMHKSICWDPRFLNSFCRLFPFQSMKVVRLRLRLVEKLLAQESLGVKVVLLVRDPRGSLQSRSHRDWCPTEPDCSDPALLCADLVSDFKAAKKFSKKYPQNFRIVRYEDLSVDPYEYVKDLYKFYGLDLHPNIKRYLDTHTKTDYGAVSSTFRNSKAAPFHWRTDLDFEEVQEIQDACSVAMQLWGYVQAVNATHQKYFNPITNFSLDHPVDVNDIF
ncbi:carbohydrate sulfotransferase 4-like isoform X2 [Belonocnema kinseyi]|nr:carbohydrate sulfotransferase 4-like isoform X2 [Belonocnema kinseyi]XP_033222949.1 carbohydrate sulfotransferase 4-like isoform X2 [Belonocnema kinseyi]XP_033222950.1 carbohydrate sulfotransferase 4-like isoform X2 [Belonocnema kinseyi]XP_033222951.1 carbohydrate sulfotransferase 4-like isoform X2 [Belonocnema kinseyi]